MTDKNHTFVLNVCLYMCVCMIMYMYRKKYSTEKEGYIAQCRVLT